MTLTLSFIALASFVGLVALMLRLRSELKPGVVETNHGNKEMLDDVPAEFYNAFAGQQPKKARTVVLQREAA